MPVERLAVLKNIILILLLLVGVFAVSFYAEPVKNTALGMFQVHDDKVLGASSSRAQDITDKVSSDIMDHLESAKEAALNVTLGDAIQIIFRAQKIPQDVNAAIEFGKEQVENITKK